MGVEVAIVCLCMAAVTSATGNTPPPTGECVWDQVVRDPDINKLKPLVGFSQNVTVPNDSGQTKYTYEVNICVKGKMNSSSTAGVLQLEEKSQKTIGNMMVSDLVGGTDWLMLEYDQGDSYGSHCNGANRTAIILIRCLPGSKGNLAFLDENTDRAENDCHYLFELQHGAICPKSGLSGGSIFIIIFVVIGLVYLILGFFYQRCVAGASGFEQLPNYNFWKNFGSLQADGCDLVCRCGGRQESKEYRSIDDAIASHIDTPPRTERDDSLLNM